MPQSVPDVTVHSEPPTDVPPDAFQSVLSYFGITETCDQNGARQWIITIQHEASTASQRHAVFEQSTSTWKLSDRSVATDVVANVPVSPLSVPSGSSFPPDELPAEKDSPTQLSPFDSPDWVHTLPCTAHTDFFQGVDWSNTQLGPLNTWPRSLRLYTYMVLSQQTPAALYWGSDHIAIYNEGCAPLLGRAHPDFMGAGFFDVWADLRSSFESIFERIESTGIGIDLSDYNLFLDRNHYTEETWWTGNLFPLAQEDGTVGGCCFMWNEVTRQVLTDRRTKLLNELGQFDINGEGVWPHIKKTLRRNPRDIAMAILYRTDDLDPDEDRILHCEGAVGIDTNHVAAPERLNLDKSQSGFAPALRKALESSGSWVAIERDTDNFPPEVLEGVDWQGYGEASRDIIIIPLEVLNHHVRGFVILGMNPRRSFDSDHRQFVSDLQRQLITIMTSVTTAEQARQREAKLMIDLAESEQRIRQLAELAPMGLFDLTADGRMRWANNHYFSIMGIERPKNIAETPWIEPVDPTDLVRVEQIFRSCLENDSELAGTVRLSRRWHPPQSEQYGDKSEGEHVHVYFQAFSFKENGVTTSIMGSVTDVSRFVWAESVQTQVAEDAQRARQRQEEFIDIVSHELRNPLSAVTQCADGIIQSLQELNITEADLNLKQAVEHCADAADSILLCATHQKRIVDDVLTLSKLDSDLIKLVPSVFQPVALQKEALHMFRSEFLANHINVQVEGDDSEFPTTETLICDPARLSQVLVNLLTNAIKFQRSTGESRINIRYGVCRQPPPESVFGKHFKWSNPSASKYPDYTLNDAYGTGEQVYLHFSVQDTGQGLPREKAVQIFDKFIQASRRTHVKYGGSGLGLYISRELTQMQGGRIGVASEDGQGSTFAFYVKARTAVPRKASLAPRSVIPADAKFEILLVEDNLVNQKVLAKQLRKAGCTVHVANHGGEAVDFLLGASGRSPEYGTTPTVTPVHLDCILMDWEMPILDGLAATRRIRELERQAIVGEKQIILGVTANARSEQIHTAMQAGMDAVVTKPFRVPELMAKIHDLVQNTT